VAYVTADYYVDLNPAASTTAEIRAVHAAWEAAVAHARLAMDVGPYRLFLSS